jgi:parvulin-like peptidyl-prolyl isomerase
MRKKLSFLAPLLLLFSMLGLGRGEIVEEIVAIVNDDVITLSTYKEYYDYVVQMLKSQTKGEEFETQFNRIKGELLNEMITDVLLLQTAKKKQLNVSEQLKAYLENLKKQNNIESEEQFRAVLRQQGMDYDQFIKQLEENILRQAVVAYEVDRSIVVEESEVINYYKQHPEEFIEPAEYKIRAIYLSTEGRNGDELEAKKKVISEKLSAGEDFSAVAGQDSDSPMKENQGDLGTFKHGELDKALEQAVVILNVGEVTPWIEARNGWYVLKLEEKKDSRPLTLEESKKKIEEQLFAEKRGKKLQEFLKQIKEQSYIKIVNPNPLNL